MQHYVSKSIKKWNWVYYFTSLNKNRIVIGSVSDGDKHW